MSNNFDINAIMDEVERDYMGPNRIKFTETKGYKALAKDLEAMKSQHPEIVAAMQKRMERGDYSDIEHPGNLELLTDLVAAGFTDMVEHFQNDCYEDIQ
jgi:DNA-binding cell septation regulator SpoVG